MNWMLRLRLTVVFMLLWLAFIFNIERYHEPINLASFVYVLNAVFAALIIATPKLRTATLVEIMVMTFVIYGGLKWWFGYEFFGPKLPITVTECVCLVITNVLAITIARQVDAFMRSAAEMSAVQTTAKMLSMGECEKKMYDEVQRARRFERHLSVANITFSHRFDAEQVDRLLRQARLEIARQFLETRIAKRLSDSIRSTDLVVSRDGAFLLLFPESTEKNVRPKLKQLAEELYDEFGILVRIGLAQFPDDECTLNGLIERAEADAAAVEWRVAPESNGTTWQPSRSPAPDGQNVNNVSEAEA